MYKLDFFNILDKQTSGCYNTVKCKWQRCHLLKNLSPFQVIGGKIMKKLIAVVLTVAMMLTVCAFSVSAEAATPELLVQGAADVQAGDEYTVSIRLNDAGNTVGGFQGELAYTGAVVKEIIANPEVLTFNNTEDQATVIKDDGDSVNFATVADLKGTNPATRIWFKVTFTVNNAAAFTLENVVFSDKNAAVLTGTVGAALKPNVVAADAANVTLNAVGILEQKVANDQGIVVNAGIANIDKNATEYGVVFYPTSLLKGAELTVDTAGAVKAFTKAGDASFEKFMNTGSFNAVLHFNFGSEANANKVLGTKVSARVYYVVGDKVYYSANSEDKYIQGGVSSKAVLNTVLDKGDTVAEADNKSEISVPDYNAAKAALKTTDTDWQKNRITVLSFAVDNFAK